MTQELKKLYRYAFVLKNSVKLWQDGNEIKMSIAYGGKDFIIDMLVIKDGRIETYNFLKGIL